MNERAVVVVIIIIKYFSIPFYFVFARVNDICTECASVEVTGTSLLFFCSVRLFAEF